MSCPGPFEKFTVESERDADMKKTPISTGIGRERLGSTESAGGSGSRAIGANGTSGMDTKIDWLVRTMREIKDEMVCKREIKMLIKEVVQEELNAIKQEMEDLRRMVRGGMHGPTENGYSSYSDIVKKKKENIIIIKPKIQQESEITKKIIKEKVDIKNMPMGITKVRKGKEGTVILGCETGEEMDKRCSAVQAR